MGKIAFLYPGQGAQKIGMGAELLACSPDLFERYLVQSERVSHQPVTRYCLEGPIENLTQTHIAQPALFAYSLALTEYARSLCLRPDFVAGHSLGEYTAAVASGALSIEDGMALVCQRGRLMHSVQAEHPGSMAAIIGPSVTTVQDLCKASLPSGFVTIANVNTPNQLVISGEETAVLNVVEAVRAAHIGKAIPLKVGGAFHSPFMQPVQEALSTISQGMIWHDATIAIAANVSGSLLAAGQHIRQELLDQITQPVQWIACITTLLEAGCDTFLEIGAGSTLTGFMRSIAPNKECFAANSPQKLVAFSETHIALLNQ